MLCVDDSQTGDIMNETRFLFSLSMVYLSQMNVFGYSWIKISIALRAISFITHNKVVRA